MDHIYSFTDDSGLLPHYFRIMMITFQEKKSMFGQE
jgi:hypothetical protein